MEVLPAHVSSIPNASAISTVVGASRDPPASEAPTEDQLAKAHWDSKMDLISRVALISGAAKAPQDIVSV